MKNVAEKNNRTLTTECRFSDSQILFYSNDCAMKHHQTILQRAAIKALGVFQIAWNSVEKNFSF